MLIRLSFLLVILGCLFSCVPNTRYIPLQYQDVNAKNLPKDSVLRVRQLALADFIIKPQDQLSIRAQSLTPDEFNFFKLDPVIAGGTNMQGGMGVIGHIVDKEGNVHLPVLGKVRLAGLTLEQAENAITNLLKPLLRDPIVVIRILNFRFTFAGEVNAVVTSPSPRISLLEAVTMAGGFSELSDRQNIKIIRQKNDQAEVFYVNLLEEKFIESPYFWLQQNDIIVVPPLRQRTTRQYFTQNLSLFISMITLTISAASLLSK